MRISAWNKVFLSPGLGLDCLSADHDFLLQGDVFTKDQIDGYIALKMGEVELFEHTPHPVEFGMYYSC